ncbi:MAG: hypothetical protein BWY82_02039 [Verrucomicrobia bacterium ADurb.Bin474]|nr:MAG: hypothetical protein BWY82_02039 [Verrucomicrobia bacterium ADurb.Bin474]
MGYQHDRRGLCPRVVRCEGPPHNRMHTECVAKIMAHIRSQLLPMPHAGLEVDGVIEDTNDAVKDLLLFLEKME